MALPPITPELRAAANAARAVAVATRKDIEARLKTGAIKVEYVLDRADTNKAIGRMHVRTLLASLPGVGYKGAYKIIHDLAIAENARVKGLGSNQKQALREMFP